ncbi:hypothetical protein PRJ39_06690 [Lysobacter enzymogenes]|uniref:hypothetical protein n=1 Tax=Lysobacter enzymogenes TaxID=69 RepID=UPI003748CAC3
MQQAIGAALTFWIKRRCGAAVHAHSLSSLRVVLQAVYIDQTDCGEAVPTLLGIGAIQESEWQQRESVTQIETVPNAQTLGTIILAF